MELVLTYRPEGEKFLPWASSNLLNAFLWCNDINIGDNGKDFEMSYNYLYHMYDIHLYAIGKNARTDHFDKFVKFFKDRGYRLRIHSDYRWEHGVDENGRKIDKMVKGMRIWIYPKAEKEKEL